MAKQYNGYRVDNPTGSVSSLSACPQLLAYRMLYPAAVGPRRSRPIRARSPPDFRSWLM